MGSSLKKIVAAAGFSLLSACASNNVDNTNAVEEINPESGCVKVEAYDGGAIQMEEQIVCPIAAPPADENTL